jgi:hypothetical protein
MKLSIHSFTRLAALLFTFLASGCSDSESVLGSCDAGIASDKSKMCIDYYKVDNLNQWRSVCTEVMQGEWSDSACNTVNALGGCQLKDGKAIIWLYPSDKHQAIEDVEKQCAKKNRPFLLPAK